MTISLLHIVVPTVLALAVLILYMTSCKNRILKEISQLKAQLEKLENIPASDIPEKAEEPIRTVQTETETLTEENEKIEEKDAPEPETAENDASTYNTGKSGKIYTKEELELLIKE